MYCKSLMREVSILRKGVEPGIKYGTFWFLPQNLNKNGGWGMKSGPVSLSIFRIKCVVLL